MLKVTMDNTVKGRLFPSENRSILKVKTFLSGGWVLTARLGKCDLVKENFIFTIL